MYYLLQVWKVIISSFVKKVNHQKLQSHYLPQVFIKFSEDKRWDVGNKPLTVPCIQNHAPWAPVLRMLLTEGGPGSNLLAKHMSSTLLISEVVQLHSVYVPFKVEQPHKYTQCKWTATESVGVGSSPMKTLEKVREVSEDLQKAISSLLRACWPHS